MTTPLQTVFQQQLSERRHKLQAAISESADPGHLQYLLAEVDQALERLNNGSFGLCEACHDPIETDRLYANPLLKFCLDHLSPPEQRALEQDLELASRVQMGLLPRQDAVIDGWQVSYHYQPLGPVSGDYCDLVNGHDGTLYFLLGDVSGKGVAASMLMSHLHALFRTLISIGLPLGPLVERAGRVFGESTLPTHFATLICGRATGSGEVEICNAGHLPPLLVREGQIMRIDGADLPLGIFPSAEFTTQNIHLARGDSLILYTDGLSEAPDARGAEYGLERLMRKVSELGNIPTGQLIRSLVRDLRDFQAGASRIDDLSIMAIQRVI